MCMSSRYCEEGGEELETLHLQTQMWHLLLSSLEHSLNADGREASVTDRFSGARVRANKYPQAAAGLSRTH